MTEQLELFPQQETQANGSVELPKQELLKDSEWCFQFFNNEPIVFGWQPENVEPSPLVLQIQPIAGESLTFQQNGMVFRIFPREISEETKIERKNESNNVNADKNQETTSESSNS
jgi:hypothetical protein